MIVTEYSFGLAKSSNKRRTVALGFFDGMHLAHRELLASAVSIARRDGTVPAVFTFSAHSMGRKKRGGLIYSTKDKLAIMEQMGVEEVFVADFTLLCPLSPEEFVSRVLIDDLNCSVAVSGYNFRFGKGAQAGHEELSTLMQARGGKTVVCDPVCIDGTPISSSAIRSALSLGRVDIASKMLGEPYFINGVVSKGIGKGRGLGFPTVNTDLPDGCPLMRGVYRGVTHINGARYNTVTNIGTCPTLGERAEHAETYIIDFDGDLYGQTLKIALLGFVREEKQFPTPEHLSRRIEEDMRVAIEENGDDVWQEIGQN